jgi:hypothetical protein
MHPQLAEVIGIAAAGASLYAAHSRTIIPLRVAAIAANALAMAYSFLHGTYPTFVLNLVLLPMNAWRLHGMLKLIGDIDVAVKGDMNADWLLPYTRPKSFKAGDVMMQRGEYATAAFYVVSGEVEIPELGKILGAGTLLLRDRPVHARRAAPPQRALQDRCPHRGDRLRSVQGALFPESAVRLPSAAPGGRPPGRERAGGLVDTTNGAAASQ